MFAGMFEEEDSEPFIGPLHINSSSSSTIYHSFVSSDVKVKADSGFVGLLNQYCFLFYLFLIGHFFQKKKQFKIIIEAQHVT